MNVLVTGAGGLLSHALLRVLDRPDIETRPLTRPQLDVTSPLAVAEAVHRECPDVVFHCAAYTAVDRAEEEPEVAMAVNRDGARNVARAAADAGALMVYPSTDYVFSGTGSVPYRIDDPPDPRSAYGRSKLAGESAVRAAGGRSLIVRTSWLYGAGGRNFVDSMLQLAEDRPRMSVVDDQTGRPTWTMDLAAALVELIMGGHEGTFHVAGGGQATWRELAVEAFRIAGRATVVDATTTEAFGAPAPRPRYSVLDLSSAENALGRTMPQWRDSLAAYLAESAAPSAVTAVTSEPPTPSD